MNVAPFLCSGTLKESHPISDTYLMARRRTSKQLHTRVIALVVLIVGGAVAFGLWASCRNTAGDVTDKEKLTVAIPKSQTPPPVRVLLREATKSHNDGGIAIRPWTQDTALTQVGDRLYRGAVEVVNAPRDSKFKTLVVNTVSLEEYTAGSLGWEMSPGWPSDALKAQAVAIRTYVLFMIFSGRGKGRAWDVDDTTAYLRYGGIGPPNSRHDGADVMRATRETRGEVLLWDGLIFKAYFHATSGGRTTNPTTVFGQETIPPLAGARLGDFGQDAPRYRWENSMRRTELERRLAAANVAVGTVTSIERVDSDPSGRAHEVVVSGNKGNTTMTSERFRRIAGSDSLLSSAFAAHVNGDWIRFSGRGWGHGVGLDQWAARSMAKAGHDYRRILTAMYPDSRLERPWGG